MKFILPRLLVVCCGALLCATPLSAAVFQVINTNVEGPGSLAQAIMDANNLKGEDEIVFAIPGAGVHIIDVSTRELPALEDPVTIDGYTQPGATPNTLAIGNNAVIQIQIDGGGFFSDAGNGLKLSSACVIRGLSITGFSRDPLSTAISIDAGDTLQAHILNRIEGNFIGVAADGLNANGNRTGVRVAPAGGFNTVGGATPTARNVIAANGLGIYAELGAILGNYIGWDPSGLRQGFGNEVGIQASGPGVLIGGPGAGEGNVIGNNFVGIQSFGFRARDDETSIQGNLIGPRADGGAAFGNDFGIDIRGGRTSVGGLAANEGNTIAFNQTGVAVVGPDPVTVGNCILSNRMYANAMIDIDLASDGPTPNDFGDSDTGTNLLQNFPVISAVTRSATETGVSGGLNSQAMSTFMLQFFVNTGGSSAGGNLDQVLLGTETVTTNSAGDARFEFTFPIATQPTDFITATATDADSNTSEFFPRDGSAEFANISTRGRVGTGDDILIAGLILDLVGREFLVRAIGPSLGVPGMLADPQLRVLDRNGVVVAQNDNWRGEQAEAIEATGLAPTNELEAAAIVPLIDRSYTVQVSGVDAGMGVGLVEVYPLDTASSIPNLLNLSTRGKVGTGDNVLIGGLIVAGSAAQKVIIRAIGPDLAQTGVPGPLLDPTLELHDGEGNLLATNDDWRSDQAAEIIATGFPPGDDRDSAIVTTLLPSAYTAIVRGKSGMIGIALVEFYRLD